MLQSRQFVRQKGSAVNLYLVADIFQRGNKIIFFGKHRNVTAITGDRGTPIGAAEVTGEFSGAVTVTGNSTLTLVDGQNTSSGTETLIGASNVKDEASVTIEDSSQINAWSGTMDKSNLSDSNRNGCKDAMNGGTFTSVSMTEDGLADIIKGVEIELIIVPKLISSAVISGTVNADNFWGDVAAKIIKAEKGSELVIEAGSRTSIPVSVLELAQEHEITLIIVWDGGED